MKSVLAEKLLSICLVDRELSGSYDIVTNTVGIDNLTEEQRTQVEEELMKHFEFSEISWIELPSGLDQDGNPIVVKTVKISDSKNSDYSGKVGYVYRIVFTPVMYDPADLHTPIKDGGVIAPLLIDPLTMLPKRSVTIEWLPEFPQDIDNPQTWEDQKKIVRDKLEAILENPHEYTPQGHRGCLLRFTAR